MWKVHKEMFLFVLFFLFQSTNVVLYKLVLSKIISFMLYYMNVCMYLCMLYRVHIEYQLKIEINWGT